HRPSLTHDLPVTAVALSPDGRLVLTGTADGSVYLWDAESSERLKGPLSHPWPLHSVAFDNSGKRFMTVSEAVCRVWDAGSADPLGLALGDKRASAVVHPNGEQVLIASSKAAQFWDIATRKATGPAFRHEDEITCIALNPDGSALLTATAGVLLRRN